MCVEDTLIVNTKNYVSKQEIFNTAGQLAVEHTIAMGHPVTFVRDDKIVKEYPDGKVEILGKASPRIKTGKKIISLKK